MSKRKLLLADDSITIQKVVNLTFADEGIEVVAVGDGDAAMEKINESLPDLILADVNMPGLSGYEICEQIKQNADTKAIPVILLVGSFEPFDEAKAERIGANDYLTKPFQSIRQLVNKVTELLDAKNEPAENAAVVAETNEDENAWQYAETKELPPEMVETAQFGDAAMDDEMIDAEHFGRNSETADMSQTVYSFAPESGAQTEETASNFVSTGEENAAEETTEEAESVAENEYYAADPIENEDKKETSFAIVSNEDEDEFQKEFPTLDEPADAPATQFEDATVDYRETETADAEPFETQTETPIYSTYSEVESETETSGAVYEFADSEDEKTAATAADLQEEPLNLREEESVSESFDSYAAPSTDFEEAAPTYADERASETAFTNEEISAEDDRFATAEDEKEEAHFAAPSFEETVEETEETSASEFVSDSRETAEKSEFAASDTTETQDAEQFAEASEMRADETVSEPEETATVSDQAEDTSVSMPETHETSAAETEKPVEETETATTAQSLTAAKEFSPSKAAPAFDIDDNLLEIPPLVKPSAPAPPVAETQPEAQPFAATESVTANENTPVNESALTSAELQPTTDAVIKEHIIEAAGSSDMSPEMIEAIAQKVAEKLSDRAIREIAWEVVPQMTELIIKKMAEEREGKK